MSNKMTVATLVLFTALGSLAWADKKLDDAVAKAEDQLQKGKPDEAEKTLQKIAQAQGTPEAHLAFARLLLKVGKEDEAAAALTSAVQAGGAASPGAKALVLAAQAEFELLAGSGKQALTRAQEAVAAESNARTLGVLARAQVRVGDGNALQTAEKAVAAGAGSADALLAKGEAQLAAHQAAQAEASLRAAVAADPKSTAAQIALARALIEQGKAVEAIAEAKRTTEQDPHNAEGFAVLALALLKQDPQKNWSEAIGHAQNGAFENPKSAMTMIAVGTLFEAAGNYTQALQSYESALAADPGLTAARLAKVKAQMRKDPKGAVGEACRVAAEMPASGDMQLMCANALLLAGDYAKAVPYLEKATQLTHNVAEGHMRLAYAYFSSNQADKAVAPCKKAAELDPNNMDTLTSCGLIVAKGGDSAAGATMLKKVTSAPGYRDAAGFMNLGWLYRNMTPPKAEESVAAYRKALEIDPKNAQAALGIAWAYVFAERWPDAEAAFQKAIEIDPKLAGAANYGIARTYYAREDMARAREFADKAAAGGIDVAQFKGFIDKYEKATADVEARKRLIAEQRSQAAKEATEEGPSLPALIQKLLYGNVAAKRQACRDLIPFGAQAAEQMAGVLRREPDVSVREACVQALGAMGAKAKAALPTLEYLISDPPGTNPGATIEEAKAELRELDLIKAMKAAVAKIKAGG